MVLESSMAVEWNQGFWTLVLLWHCSVHDYMFKSLSALHKKVHQLTTCFAVPETNDDTCIVCSCSLIHRLSSSSLLRVTAWVLSQTRHSWMLWSSVSTSEGRERQPCIRCGVIEVIYYSKCCRCVAQLEAVHLSGE